MSCAHDGFHTGQGRYEPRSGHLRYVLICEDCHQEVSEVHAETYEPRFDPNGNDEFLKAA